jgi:hypothetical protein
MQSIRYGRNILCATLLMALVAGPARASEVSQYLPDGTVVVVSFNFKQLMDAPLLKADEKAFKEHMNGFAKALEGFGVDPNKDIKRVVFAGGLDPKNVVVLLEGKFDTDKLNAKLKELAKDKDAHLKVADDDKVAHYKVKLPKMAIPQAGNLPEELVLAPLDENFVAVALEKDAISDAVAKRSGKKGEVKKDVVELVGKISPKETLSFVVVPPQEMLAGSPVDGLKTVTGGVTVGDGVKTDILMSMKDAASATSLAQMINEGLSNVKQFLPIVATQAPNFGPKEQKMVQDLIDLFKANAKDDSVRLQGMISKEFINKNSKKDQ